jgi:AcrR family transcriptional regulator
MALKLGLSPEDVLAAAEEIVNADGLEALTLASVAEKLGIRSPSLYAHVPGGLQELRRQLALRGAGALEDELRDSAIGSTGLEALRRIFVAYRRFATAEPGLYDALDRAVQDQLDEELADALTWLAEPIDAALTQAGIPSPERPHLLRTVRACLHGFVTLESAGAFDAGDAEIDGSFARLVDLLLAGVRMATSKQSP